MQAPITIVGTDIRNSIRYVCSMPTHDQIRDELIRQIDAGLIKQARVAKALGLPPPRIAEIRSGERRIQQDEMRPLAELLDMTTEYEAKVASTLPMLDETEQKLVWDMVSTLAAKK